MNILKRLFARTSPSPVPLRDNDGKFLPHHIAVRRRAIELAQSMGRTDLVTRLTGETA